jgi:TusA-related sulfurtransferase
MWPADSTFDGGETGCGELLVDLKLHVRQLPPGSRLLVIARDAAAPAEMPAWCRMTGHELLQASHPRYLIRVREKEVS